MYTTHCARDKKEVWVWACSAQRYDVPASLAQQPLKRHPQPYLVVK